MDYDYKPSLTLTPETAEAPSAESIISAAEEKASAPAFTMDSLTEAEKKAVSDFADTIDISDTNQVLQYGSAAQKNISDFSGAALGNVRTKDMGEVGNMLGDLVLQLKNLDFDPEDKKGLKGIFKKSANKIAGLKAQYEKAEINVTHISDELEKHQVTLLKDVAMLDKMYELNQSYFKELNMYILAGKQALANARDTRLKELLEKAQQSGRPEDAQEANDFANMCTRFEKKIHDLELTRTISLQMSPQIRLIQNNDTLMVEKIQTSIVNTIPLWKSQMVLALGIAHSQQAMEAQRAVTEVTNELLRKNSEMLKTGSIEVAQESERGIVELETLKTTNESLISTLEEVRRIQSEGADKRRAAEEELARIENELRAKLLELNK
ncbi:MAG: toxic anion resistance protein [Oscillospiraceae bacterium]|nr:toxic anion resistance protein [Oscillospiraceae bacterium]